MLKHYFTICARHLLRHKPYAALNILNLAVGMACAVLIGLYIQDERAYDRYHDNADRIYRVVNGTNAKTTPALGPAIQELLPEVQSFARLSPPFGGWIIRYEDQSYFEDRVFWADPEVFDVFLSTGAGQSRAGAAGSGIGRHHRVHGAQVLRERGSAR